MKKPFLVFSITTPCSGDMIFYPGKVVMCHIFLDVDGFWKVEASSFGAGFIESGHLKLLVLKLEELNATHEMKIQDYFKNT